MSSGEKKAKILSRAMYTSDGTWDQEMENQYGQFGRAKKDSE